MLAQNEVVDVLDLKVQAKRQLPLTIFILFGETKIARRAKPMTLISTVARIGAMKDVLEEKCQEWKWTPSAAETREMIWDVCTGRCREGRSNSEVVQPHSCQGAWEPRIDGLGKQDLKLQGLQ